MYIFLGYIESCGDVGVIGVIGVISQLCATRWLSV